MDSKCIEHKYDNGKCAVCGESLVIITKSNYEYLLEQESILEFLDALGVDNWHGYRLPPNRDSYETEDEWSEAYEKALYEY